MALAQGSGELIFWPQIVAKYGLAFVFLMIPACLLQFPITFEIGRYTTLTGEGILRGFFRLHRGFGALMWLMFTASFLWFGGYATAGCTAIVALTDWPLGWSDQQQTLFWAQCTILLFTVALLWVKFVYRLIEWVMKVVAVVCLAGMAIACSHPQVRSQLGAFVRGLVVPDVELMRSFDPADAERLLSAITFAGLGGFFMLFYSYWMREKGAGMARSGAVALPADSPEAPQRLRSWYRFVAVDASVGIVGNILTTLMTCLLAFALLHPQRLVPENHQIAVIQAEFFAVSWGDAGRVLFLVIAAAFLVDTWLATVDSVSRAHLDVLTHVWPKLAAKDPRKLYNALVLLGAVITSLTMYWSQPEALIVASAVIGFVGVVIFSGGLLVLNHIYLRRRLPASMRSGRGSLTLIAISTACYLLLAVIYFYAKLSA